MGRKNLRAGRIACAAAALSLLPLAVAAEPAPPTAAVVAFAPDNEYFADYAVSRVKAGDAHKRGYTGKGVVVAVFDTGLATGNAEFRGRIAGPGYDAYTGALSVTKDGAWHGTFVAGIIAANRNGTGVEGVAYEAQLLPVRIINAKGWVTLDDDELAQAVRYATPKARIQNHSWNSSTPIGKMSRTALQISMPELLGAYREAVKAGSIIVFAAGNESMKEPGYYAGLPLRFSELQAGWVAVVATNGNGGLAGYSNQCGSAAAWCIAAPGSDVYSTSPGGQYTYGNGTSFAAPVVSGAAAILVQMWPHLSNKEVLSILFTTADKSGVYANKTIYGQGFLNLEKATRPVGTVSVPTSSTTATKSTLKALTSTLALLIRSLGFSSLGKTNAQVMVLDGYGRDYYVPLRSLVRQASSRYDSWDGLTRLGMAMETVEGPGGASLSFATAGRTAGTTADGMPRATFSTPAGDDRVALTRGVSPGQLFGGLPAELERRAMLPSPDGLHSGYLALTGTDSWGAAYERALAGSLRLTVAGFGGSQADRPSEWSVMAREPYRSRSASTSLGAVARLSAVAGPAAFAIETGVVSEHNTVLGNVSEGAMRLGDGAATSFVGIAAETRLGRGFALFGGFEAGITHVTAPRDSMVADISSIATTAFRLGAAKTGVIGDDDRLALTFSQPVRALSGRARLSLPVGRELDGTIRRAPMDQSLSADGRELDLQLGYTATIEAGQDVTLGALVRFQPGNLRGAETEGALIARYRFKL